MTYNKPTLKEIQKRVKSDLSLRLNTVSVFRQSLIVVLSYVIAGISYSLHSSIEFVYLNLLPSGPDSAFLEIWASIFKIPRKQPTRSTMGFSLEGIDGTVIHKGSKFSAGSNVYEVIEEKTISSGTAIVQGISQNFGTSQNLKEGDKVSIINPIEGLKPRGSVVLSSSVLATDRESNESLYKRFIFRVQNPPRGGSNADYQWWAKENSGVTRVWVEERENAYSVITPVIRFVLDGEANIFPSPAKVLEVKNYILDRKPVTAKIEVLSPVEKSINLVISIAPNSASVQGAILDELKDLFFRECSPGSTLKISKIREAVSIAAGELDSIISSHQADITSSSDELLTLGSVSFNSI